MCVIYTYSLHNRVSVKKLYSFILLLSVTAYPLQGSRGLEPIPADIGRGWGTPWIRVHSYLAQLPCTVPKYDCPFSPLSRWPAVKLLQSNQARARLSYLIIGVRPVFLLKFFHHVIKFLNCSLSTI